THKRLMRDGEDATMHTEASAIDDGTACPSLVRVTDGDEIKISTTIAPGSLEAFHTTYDSLLKASFTTESAKSSAWGKLSSGRRCWKMSLLWGLKAILGGR
ncbi:hypothetical protein BDQ17DRAFT_1365524, partial [Cyathus striatus]